jgi:hypothetical protein
MDMGESFVRPDLLADFEDLFGIVKESIETKLSSACSRGHSRCGGK